MVIALDKPPLRDLARLRVFIRSMADLVEREQDEATLLNQGSELLSELISHDDWLPEAYAQPSPVRYRQYLLYADVRQKFSVVSFVWGPGQETPIHNHTVWGLIGQLRGKEVTQPFVLNEKGLPMLQGKPITMRAGDVSAVSPTIGDLHAVRNASASEVAISIHVYGGNIGTLQRSAISKTGEKKMFVSGYSNASIPNLWDAP